MGVSGLWELLAPTGRHVPIEHLSGRKVAVDVSVWLTQFVKAMRDSNGMMFRNAHLLGFFRRCLRLLYHGIRPVFVFDGATPYLKRRTVMARVAARDKQNLKLRRLASRLLENRIKMAILDSAQASNDQVESSELQPRSSAASAQSPQELKDSVDVLDEAQQLEASDDETQNDDHEERSEYEDGTNTASRAPNTAEAHGKACTAEPEEKRAASSRDMFRTHQRGLFVVDRSATNNASASDPANLYVQDVRDGTTRTLINPGIMDSDPRAAPLHELRTPSGVAIAQYLRTKPRWSDPSRRAEVAVASASSFRVKNGAGPSAAVRNPQPQSDDLDDDELVLPDDEEDVDLEAVVQLPATTQNEIYETLRLRRRIRNRSQSAKQATDPSSFSRAQMEGFLKSIRLNKRIKVARGQSEELQQGRRQMAGDTARHVIFERNHISGSESEPTHLPQLRNESIVFWANANERNRTASGKDALDKSHKLSVPWATSALQQKREARFVPLLPIERGASEVTNKKVLLYSNDLGEESESSGVEWEDVSALPHPRGEIVEDEERRDDSDSDLQQAIVMSLSENLASQVNSQRKRARLVREDSEEDSLTEPNEKRSSQVRSSSQNSDCTPFAHMPAHAASSTAPALMPSSTVDNLPQGSHTAQDGSEDDDELDHAIALSLERRDGDRTDTADAKNRAVTAEEAPRTRLLVASPEVLGTGSGTEAYFSLNAADNENKMPASDEKVRAEINSAAQRLDTERVTQTFTETPSVKDPHDEVARKHVTFNLTIKDSGNPLNLADCEPAERLGSHDKSRTSQNADELIDKFDEEEDVDEIRISHVRKEASLDADVQESVLERELNEQRLEALREEINATSAELHTDLRGARAASATVSDEMYSETRELLKLFGLPYLEAPFEAEAQCAWLNAEGLVDAVITEDSDAFVFGAKVVCRNIFDQNKYVEMYEADAICDELGLDQARLVRLALLLGSDYTEGVRGIGIVNASEVIHAFPELEDERGLSDFANWVRSPHFERFDIGDSSQMKQGAASAVRLSPFEPNSEKDKFAYKHRNLKKHWILRDDFPSKTVIAAYENPDVDKNRHPFTWHQVNPTGLEQFCWAKFGWDARKTHESLDPVLARWNPEAPTLRQSRIDDFFRPTRFAKIRSKRLQSAVSGISGKDQRSVLGVPNANITTVRNELPCTDGSRESEQGEEKKGLARNKRRSRNGENLESN
ncbi:DNA repair protein UVH3 [Porphyridium purpureum]|uniref:DNA repair protein UVH3 n=1 Tax=Porphyridium purpureum TaxID=35688 RepID=A0A5J4YY82_PORPP|nr:DNA repair protein UVH3 [Porphyridium purpureum]|eukprot:POR5407..scf209_3